MIFPDRREAGRLLGERLARLDLEAPLVLGLPRGGVPVAIEVARALGAPMDLLAVRKLGAPGNPELAVGAIAEGGSGVLDRQLARYLGLTDERLARTVERERRELERRVTRFREGRPPRDVAGRTVVVVDDGLATGLSDLAAVEALRTRGAGRIVVAAPVGSREGVALLREAADEVVCVTVPERLVSVGHWYRDFEQVSDAEVLALLASAGDLVGALTGHPDPEGTVSDRGRVIGELIEDLLRRAGEPVREAVLYERAHARLPDLTPSELLEVLEALAVRGNVNVTVERDLPAHDPEPFEPRFWRVIR